MIYIMLFNYGDFIETNNIIGNGNFIEYEPEWLSYSITFTYNKSILLFKDDIYYNFYLNFQHNYDTCINLWDTINFDLNLNDIMINYVENKETNKLLGYGYFLLYKLINNFKSIDKKTFYTFINKHFNKEKFEKKTIIQHKQIHKMIVGNNYTRLYINYEHNLYPLITKYTKSQTPFCLLSKNKLVFDRWYNNNITNTTNKLYPINNKYIFKNY